MQVAATVSVGDGRPEMQARNAVLTAAMNVVLTAALAPIFGLWGIVVGTFVAIGGGGLLFVYRFHRAYSIPSRVFAQAVTPPALLSLGLGLPFAAVAVAVGVPDTRLVAAVALAAAVGGYGALYWLAASSLGWLPERLTAPWAARRGRPVATGGVAR
jgi:peptidoglycan biosynthesis protein MviN/MurJ (putative lipid II flippase)